jgi:GT2 family glycosyltransferase
MKMALAARRASKIQPPAGEQVTTPFQASAIIPTHNRQQLLEMTLEHLARQTVDLSSVEVIVVADGCTDGTIDMLTSHGWPFSLRVLQQEQRGRACARNAAAAAARAPVLIFLDDDVMAAPDLIEKHLAEHQDDVPTAAIGRLAPASMRGVPGWHRWVEGQLEKQYRAMLKGRRLISGVCLYSGNCSISRDAFLKINGFNERLPYSEDIELGLRLEKAGVRFRLALDASAEHWGYRGYDSWLDMAHSYGRWDAGLLYNAEFPSAVARLRDEYRRRGRIRQRFVSSALKSEQRLRLSVGALRLLAVACGFVRFSFLERKAYGAIYELTYWKGVSDELGGLRAVARGVGRAA